MHAASKNFWCGSKSPIHILGCSKFSGSVWPVKNVFCVKFALNSPVNISWCLKKNAAGQFATSTFLCVDPLPHSLTVVWKKKQKNGVSYIARNLRAVWLIIGITEAIFAGAKPPIAAVWRGFGLILPISWCDPKWSDMHRCKGRRSSLAPHSGFTPLASLRCGFCGL